MTEYKFKTKINFEDGAILLNKEIQECTIDLSEVDNMHISFIGSLIELKKRTNFRLIVSNHSRDILKMTHMYDFFKENLKMSV